MGDLEDKVSTMIAFSRYLTQTGKFGEAKEFSGMMEDQFENGEILAECARVAYVHHDYAKCADMNKKALLLYSGSDREAIAKINSDIGLALLRNN